MRRLLLSFLFAACAAQSIADHELLLKDSDSVTVEAVKGVMKSLGFNDAQADSILKQLSTCLLYTSPSPRDRQKSRMPSSA